MTRQILYVKFAIDHLKIMILNSNKSAQKKYLGMVNNYFLITILSRFFQHKFSLHGMTKDSNPDKKHNLPEKESDLKKYIKKRSNIKVI